MAGKPRASTLDDGLAWDAGHIGRRRSASGRRRSSCPTSGDFDTKQALLLRRLGQVPEPRAGRGGLRPDGRHARLPRLGPLARERQGRHPHRQQVARRRAQGRHQERRSTAERVEPRLRHLRRLGQGRRASRSTSTASRRPTEIAANEPRRTRSGRRSRSRSASGTRARGSSDVRAPGRPRLRPRRSTGRRSSNLARATRAAGHRSPSRPTSGPPPRRTSCSPGGSSAWTSRTKDADRRAGASSQQEEAAIKARGHGRPRDAGEDRAGRWPTSSTAASTTSAATR